MNTGSKNTGSKNTGSMKEGDKNLLSLRKSYGQALVDMGQKNDNVVVLEADLGKSTMSVLFQEVFPDRYFQMGIAEQNMTSTAAGLALVGKIPFINSFAVFSTGRAYDQVRSSIAIPNLNVKICGSSAGLSDYGDGKTHQSIDDIALMTVLPNMTVLVPVDAAEARRMVAAATAHPGPVYLRITRADLPNITDEKEAVEPYQIGEMSQLRRGSDCTVFAYGPLVHEALRAAEEAEKLGISTEVVNVGTLKPLNKKALAAYARDKKCVIAVDEHSVIGGLGQAAAVVLKNEKVPLYTMGIQDRFGTSASNYRELLKGYGLADSDILQTILQGCGDKDR